MKRLRFIGLLIQPSAGSFVMTITIAVVLLAAYSLTYATETGLFYEYLVGQANSVTLIEEARNTITAFNETVFGHPLLNRSITVLAWLLAGLLVCALVVLLWRGLRSTGGTLAELRYVNIKASYFGATLLQRIIIQLGALLMWAGYSIFFFNLIVPFCLLSSRIGIGSLTTLSGIGYLLMGFVVLAVSLHLHVVMMRLVLLRPRLAGGDDILTEGSTHSVK